MERWKTLAFIVCPVAAFVLNGVSPPRPSTRGQPAVVGIRPRRQLRPRARRGPASHGEDRGECNAGVR